MVDERTHSEERHSAAEVRGDIEESLGSRTTPGSTLRRRVEDLTKGGASRVWRAARRHPYVGTVLVGAGAAAAGAALGVTELALGAVAAWAAFQVLKGNEAPRAAVGNVVGDLEKAV